MPTPPVNPACDRNKDAILTALSPFIPERGAVLEIGSGTGQHAVHIAAARPDIVWQTSDLTDRHDDIRAWIEASRCANVRPPIELDVNEASQWPPPGFAVGFSANTAHILDRRGVRAMFHGVGRLLSDGGRFALYGPFNTDGRFTSEGNRRLHHWAASEFPGGGLKDQEWIESVAAEAGLDLESALSLPANNHLLVYRRSR